MKKLIKDPRAQHFFELLQSKCPSTFRAMFGGYGFYSDGGPMYALYAVDQVYFKVDNLNRKLFEDAGQGPFIYQMGDKPGVMNYYSIPAEDWLEPDKLNIWILSALQAAERAALKKGNKN